MADPRFDVTTLGEAMLRLSVPAGRRLEMAAQFDVAPAGAESNVVSALARLQRRCAWLGGLPPNPLGRLLANQLRLCGVNLDGVVWSETGRMGLYFVEFAGPPRPTQVLYDRAHSCAAQLKPEQINWELLLDTRLLHLTGITPALSQSCGDIVREAATRARRARVPISFDINYRQKLWPEAQAAEVLIECIQGVELLFCSQTDAVRLFNCQGAPEQIARRLADLSGARRIILTLGEEGVLAWDGQTFSHAAGLPTQIIDRLGAGDAMAAGVIHGWLNSDLALGLRYGAALSALALSQHGDMVVTTPEELAALLANEGGSVSR
jgi:2-dehydro-3-deoxygluconokinase